MMGIDGTMAAAVTRPRPLPLDHGGVGSADNVGIVKAVLLREEYIARLKANFGRQGSKIDKEQGALEDVVSLLDLLRSATIDSVEAIQKWRTQRHPEPFMWQGTNYLLKIPTDTDFLDGSKVRAEPIPAFTEFSLTKFILRR